MRWDGSMATFDMGHGLLRSYVLGRCSAKLKRYVKSRKLIILHLSFCEVSQIIGKCSREKRNIYSLDRVLKHHSHPCCAGIVRQAAEEKKETFRARKRVSARED